MMFLLVSSWVHKCLWGLIGLLSDYHNSPGFLCKCKDTFTALLSHITFSLAPVDRHRWAHFFWLVARTNAHVCSSGWCMRRDGVISNVFSLFVYVLIRKRLVISILSQQRWPQHDTYIVCHTHTQHNEPVQHHPMWEDLDETQTRDVMNLYQSEEAHPSMTINRRQTENNTKEL